MTVVVQGVFAPFCQEGVQGYQRPRTLSHLRPLYSDLSMRNFRTVSMQWNPPNLDVGGGGSKPQPRLRFGPCRTSLSAFSVRAIKHLNPIKALWL